MQKNTWILTPVHNRIFSIHVISTCSKYSSFFNTNHEYYLSYSTFPDLFLNKCCQKYCLPAHNSQGSLYAPRALLAFYLSIAVIPIKILTPTMIKISLRTEFIVLFIRLILQNSLNIILVSGPWDNSFLGTY